MHNITKEVILNMFELNARMFRDDFGGSWDAVITKKGVLQPEHVIFNWPEP